MLADVLIFAMRPLYGSYAAQDERLLGLSPLEDQRLAGLVMMGEQLLTLGAFAPSRSSPSTDGSPPTRGRPAASRT